MAGRKLTDEEKHRVWSYAIAQAQEEHPKSFVDVTVDDEIDEHGNARWTTSVTTEHFGPTGT